MLLKMVEIMRRRSRSRRRSRRRSRTIVLTRNPRTRNPRMKKKAKKKIMLHHWHCRKKIRKGEDKKR